MWLRIMNFAVIIRGCHLSIYKLINVHKTNLRMSSLNLLISQLYGDLGRNETNQSSVVATIHLLYKISLQ